jgi:hypothetical protein
VLTLCSLTARLDKTEDRQLLLARKPAIIFSDESTHSYLRMEFNPNNNIVKLCLQGMIMEAKGNHEEAGKLFLQAWNEATNDFEKYLAAYYLV